MGKYKVITGQNLYDVALHLYGSIEGITDLMVNNPEISLAETLNAGMELIYTDDLVIDADVVAYYRNHGITPSNGERTVYFKQAEGALAIEIQLPQRYTSAQFNASGTGLIEVDWGDNTPIERLNLREEKSDKFHHSFDNSISTLRKVRFYGDFRIRQIDLTALHPSSVVFLVPIYIERLSLNSSSAKLDFLPLAEGIYDINLSGSRIRDLSPLVQCRSVWDLDLSEADVLREEVDNFLISLVKHHFGRRNCRMILTEQPSGIYAEPERDEDMNYIINTGMEAIWLLCNEPSWNEGGLWSFDINGTIFTHEQDD